MRTVEGMITGNELSMRLEVLKDAINSHLRGASQAWGDWLEHVRRAGEALQEAYERLGRRSKWSKWVRRNCTISVRSTRDYRRIFREWGHPALVAARQNGGQPRSIQGVLKILRGKISPPSDDKTPDAVLASALRKEIRTFIAEELQEMKLEELEVLQDKIRDDLWFRLYGVLAKEVAAKFGDKYYRHGETPLRDWALEQSRRRYEKRCNQRIANSLRRDGYKV